MYKTADMVFFLRSCRVLGLLLLLLLPHLLYMQVYHLELSAGVADAVGTARRNVCF